MRLGGPSFWFDDIGGPPPPRPGLDGDTAADVAIVGAGNTGLWTALYLRQADPSLRVIVVERRFAGFGASGRNGGWLTGGFAWDPARYAARSGDGPTRAMIAALAATVPEVMAQCARLGIDADILETDELMLATNPAQWARAQAEVAARQGWGETRLSLIGADALARRLRVPGALGALVLGGVARVQPAKLVTGLARAVEAMGVRIAEGTTVTAIAPGRLDTDRGTIRAAAILRCTEGFTATLPGARRDWLPLNSAQIVTEPLSAATWDRIGWQGHEIVGDFAHVYSYCQRTREGRLVVGARGVPYRFGSRLDRDGVPDGATIARLRAVLARLFPAAAGARITHAWCGVLGVPRDWCARAGWDAATGLGHAGGYVGVGVSTANLAGRTLADLVLGRDTALTALPWVNLPARRWEPEPFRWLGVRGMYAAYGLADRLEARPGAGPSRLAAWANRLTGR